MISVSDDFSLNPCERHGHLLVCFDLDDRVILYRFVLEKYLVMQNPVVVSATINLYINC